MIKDVSRASQSCPNAEQKRYWRLQIDGEFSNPNGSLYAGINVRSDSHFIHIHKKNYNKSLQKRIAIKKQVKLQLKEFFVERLLKVFKTSTNLLLR